MNNFFSTLFYIAVGMAGLLVACESEDLDWHRPIVIFPQVEVDDNPTETREEITLGATIFDIEDENLKPQPKPVTEYGHVYASERELLEQLEGIKITSLEELDGLIKDDPHAGREKSKRALIPDNPDDKSIQIYQTIIDAEKLDNTIEYYFIAYVVKPISGEVKLSSIASKTFKVPILKVETIIPDDAEIDGEMRLKVRGVISEANNIIILEYGHRLLDENCEEVLDSCARPITDGEPFTGELEFVSEFPFFDIETTYCIQAYVKFKQEGSVKSITEYDSDLDEDEEFMSALAPGFWINTAKIRKKSAPNTNVNPPKLEGAVFFVLKDEDEKEYAYIGLGKNGTVYNDTFWRFDPRFYTWEAVGTFDEELREDAVAFVKNGCAYVGMGYKANGGGDTTFFHDFYKMEADGSWDRETYSYDINGAYSGNGVYIENDGTFIDRIGAFFYSMGDGGNIYWGGGKGLEYVRHTNVTVDCADCNINDWNDFNNDNRIDWGHWVDINNDGVINAGTEGTPGTGINLDSDPALEVLPNNYFIYISDSDENNMIQIPIKPLEGTDINELSNLPDNVIPGTQLKRSEWNDTDFDKEVDSSEINRTHIIFSDLWENNQDEWKIIQMDDPAYERYGGFGLSIGNDAYFIGGIDNASNFADSYKLEASGDLTLLNPPGSFDALFGVHFTIDSTIYYGGGEDIIGNLKPFNPKAFNVSNATMESLSCGLHHLSRGIGFSSEGKGFMGIGITEKTGGMNELTNELWMYIPE